MGRAAAVRASTKAKTDGAKAKKNNQYAKKIIIAVKAGGPDADVNKQLGQVLREAKAAQVPKDIIDRNIAKASQAATADFKSSIFEFYGHGGVGMLVNVLTDNDNRAAADVNLVAKKQNLKPAASNSVKFKFVTKARLDVGAMIEEDDLMEMCLESGVDDYELRTEMNGDPMNPQEEGKSAIFVDPKDMAALRDALREKELLVESSMAACPQEQMGLGDEDFDANMAAIDAFLALDDVDSVEHNIDMVSE
jgi:YebC/PmpR family DNA-binding regulatory protein